MHVQEYAQGNSVNDLIGALAFYGENLPEKTESTRRNRPSCRKDRAYLPYTEATIHEVLRKSSIVPFALPHFTIADTKLCGFDIDKGTVVFLNLHSVSYEKDFWGDPDVFRPERFLTKQNTLDSSKCQHVLSFGLGRRRCIGEPLVRQEIFLLFATLMQRHRLSIPYPGDVDLSPVPSLVYGPTTCKMRVHER
ncbi:CP1A1-like protein [Mya arenaria]|uniref:CP1A1-like protein n=1 Tax=Mya arenaria TaxID=6604 RepID=A0ABY7EF71_MYAAR|nr:CP1A1-like protein [Mya arenaria]